MGAAPEAGLSWLDKEALETDLKYAGVAGRQAKMQVSVSHCLQLQCGISMR